MVGLHIRRYSPALTKGKPLSISIRRVGVLVLMILTLGFITALVAPSEAKIAGHSLTVVQEAEAAAIPCNTWTVTNYSGQGTYLSDNGVWSWISPGEKSAQRSWDKIQVPNNRDVRIFSTGIYPVRVFHHSGEFYSPADWNCGTRTDQQNGGRYWGFEVGANGAFD